MRSNIHYLTHTNESITFTKEGVWIQPIGDSPSYKFTGTPAELIQILIHYADESDMNCIFKVGISRYYFKPLEVRYTTWREMLSMPDGVPPGQYIIECDNDITFFAEKRYNHSMIEYSFE